MLCAVLPAVNAPPDAPVVVLPGAFPVAVAGAVLLAIGYGALVRCARGVYPLPTGEDGEEDEGLDVEVDGDVVLLTVLLLGIGKLAPPSSG